MRRDKVVVMRGVEQRFWKHLYSGLSSLHHHIVTFTLSPNQHSTHASGKSGTPWERFTPIEFQALIFTRIVSFLFTAIYYYFIASLQTLLFTLSGIKNSFRYKLVKVVRSNKPLPISSTVDSILLLSKTSYTRSVSLQTSSCFLAPLPGSLAFLVFALSYFISLFVLSCL